MNQRTIPIEELEREYELVSVLYGRPGTRLFKKGNLCCSQDVQFVQFYALKAQVVEVQSGQREVLPVAYRQVKERSVPVQNSNGFSLFELRAITLRPITNRTTLESITKYVKEGDTEPLF
jgi:hypothetical protein